MEALTVIASPAKVTDGDKAATVDQEDTFTFEATFRTRRSSKGPTVNTEMPRDTVPATMGASISISGDVARARRRRMKDS